MPALSAVVSTCLLEEPATQLQEIQDTKHAFLVSQYLCSLFLCSCYDCDQCKSLELSALIMAIVIALAEVWEDDTLYSGEQSAELSVGIADS